MDVIFTPPKILLETRDAIYGIYPVTVDSADFIRKGTAFATKFQSDSGSVMVPLILAFTPSSEEGVNTYYIKRGSRSTSLELKKHPDVYLDGLLFAKVDQQTERSLVRKTLKLDDSVCIQEINNAQHRQSPNSFKMYVVKTSGSTPKTYLLMKVENGGKYVKYKLVNGKIDMRKELPIGAPVVNCYPRRLRKSTKKLIGMVQSVEDDGTILSVLHFNVAIINQILNESANITASVSEEHKHWIVIGNILLLGKKPIGSYVKKIVETWHEQLLREASVQFGTCTNPENCSRQKKVQDLCPACSAWYYLLALNHRSDNKSQIKWWKNCDTSRWPLDAWEVAKFFMSSPVYPKSAVKDAASTDLSSLLSVLEWMGDKAFGENNRIAISHVAKLRNVRNVWALSANQEITEAQLSTGSKVAKEFSVALNEVFNHEVVVENSITHIETELNVVLEMHRISNAELDRLSEESVEVDGAQGFSRNVKDLKGQVKRSTNQINKLGINVKRNNDQDVLEAKKAKLKSYIPEKLRSFVSRKQEINNAVSFVVEKQAAIVLVVGGPGFGKSATAVEIAHCLNDDHNIQVSFAYLGGFSTVDEVYVRLCHSLDVRPQKDPESSLIFCLKNLKERCVLVLDNIEQLLEGTTRHKFIELLYSLRMNSGQRLQILLTSTQSCTVPGLECKTVLIKPLDRNSSIQLIRACYSEKKLESSDVNNLAKLCGDVPLALRIVASRLQDVSHPKKLLKLLREDPLEVLTSPDQKVKKSIEMSFNRLQDTEQIPFVRLSVFDGSFDLQAAQVVTRLKDIHLQNFLTNLVNRNLVERSGTDRYSVHALIREFLIKCTKDGNFSLERKLAQEYMVKCFLKVCHDLTLMYWSKVGPNEARRQLLKDAHNVEKTFQLCHEAVTQVTNHETNQTITEFFKNSKIYQESSRFFYHFVLHVLSPSAVSFFLEACVEVAKQNKDAVVEVLVQCLIAHVVGRTSGWKSVEYEKKMECTQETFLKNEKLLEEASKLETCSYYRYSLYMSKGESSPSDNTFELANSYLERYCELKKKSQRHLDKIDMAITLMQLARIHKSPEKEPSAVVFYEKALECLERQLGDHDLKLCCHKELGDLYFEQENHVKAVVFYDDAMKIHRKLGAGNSNISSVYLLKNYGLSLSKMSRVEEALEYLRESLDVATKLFKGHRCLTEVYCGLAETLDKHHSGCEEAGRYANMTLTSNRRLSKDMEEKMRKIIAKANGH